MPDPEVLDGVRTCLTEITRSLHRMEQKFDRLLRSHAPRGGPAPPAYHSAEEVAVKLNLEARTVRRWCRGGALKAKKLELGGRYAWRIPAAEVERLLPGHTPEGTTT